MATPQAPEQKRPWVVGLAAQRVARTYLPRLTMADVAALKWKENPANPLIPPSLLNPIVGDPAWLAPAQTPDGRRHLFAYTVRGIMHYVSSDGLAWKPAGKAVTGGLRPSVVKYQGTFYLAYEKPATFLPSFPWLPWKSHIEVRTSKDLFHWSKPTTLLRPCLPWHDASPTRRAVGNPQLVQVPDGWRLIYSASMTLLRDGGFTEPRYIGSAHAPSILGPYTPRHEPMLGPTRDDTQNLGAGAMKILHVKDGWVGFENAIYERNGHSGSAVWLLGSADGIHWKRLQPKPLIAPTTGWKRTHVYAVDVKEVDGRLQLYFNARNDWPWWKGREGIGLTTSQPLAR